MTLAAAPAWNLTIVTTRTTAAIETDPPPTVTLTAALTAMNMTVALPNPASVA